MTPRALPITLPLPDLSDEDAVQFIEFLYELAGRFEGHYRDGIRRYYSAHERRNPLEFLNEEVVQLELFHSLDLDPF
jgi:hypothetical protein